MTGVLISAGLLIVWSLPVVLYKKKGCFKRLFHDILGWHEPDDGPKWTDGVNTFCHCRHCGERVMKDGQGNWF